MFLHYFPESTYFHYTQIDGVI